MVKETLVKHQEVSKYYKNDCSFNGIFSKGNLPTGKDISNVTNLTDKQSKETHWVSLFITKHMAVYFYSFGMDYIAHKVLSKIKGKSMTYNIFRIKDDDTTSCVDHCITFIMYACKKHFFRLYQN